MNKVILTFTILMILTTGILLQSCQSPSAQEKKANENVEQAKKDLDAAKNDAQKVANAEEWKTFKAETELKIQANKIRIEELKLKMKNSGKTLDAVYEARINMLEKQNESLNERIVTYENKQGDWETFKREFNHDMDELGKALKDFSIDNKK